MESTLRQLVDRLEDGSLYGTDVIPWSSPVPSFGDLSQADLATLGLNPSNREFVDEGGKELRGGARRFHTLTSLGLGCWADARKKHLRRIVETCRSYFLGNPYDLWFRRLDGIISSAGVSYYKNQRACHLDLIPYATASKWTVLRGAQRSALLDAAGDALGLLLRDSPIRVLVLNGSAVVRNFERVSDAELKQTERKSWALRRSTGSDVCGYSYQGTTNRVGGVPLGRQVLVIGYNHNIQSSFGVTKAVVASIRAWVGRVASKVLS